MVVQLFVEFLSGARGNFKSFAILYQLDHVARTIQDGPAISAIFKVQSHAGAQGSVLWFAKIMSGNSGPIDRTTDSRSVAQDFRNLLKINEWTLKQVVCGSFRGGD
jgi:hypothetical protein